VSESSHRRVGRPVAMVALFLAVVTPTLWFTHLSIMYALVPWSCRLGTDAPLHVATAAAVIALAVCTVVGFKLAPAHSARALRARLLGTDPQDANLDRAVPSLVAAVMAAYFGFVVVMTGLVPMVVDRCA
jgi:hypothetical protein